MSYHTVKQAADRAKAPVEDLMKLIESGTLKAVEKRGVLFVESAEIYKFRFILHLRREHRLGMEEIEQILRNHKPPYRDWQRDAIAAGNGR